MNFVDYFCHAKEVDNNIYRPSTLLYRYIDWTFRASFTSVFISFSFYYFLLCVVFGGLLLWAGNHEPNCIVTSGESFGAHSEHTKFSDAFSLSWTTFTTVGYGMTYTSTASDFADTKPAECTWVVFLCTVEAFMGLLYAGMCAAILFGKVNRVQSHAYIDFSNAVCLQYEEMDDDVGGVDFATSERSRGEPETPLRLPDIDDKVDEENQYTVGSITPAPAQSQEEKKFVDKFNGCPIMKFQIVNELCNREGAELVDCIMKVVGIKFKGPGDGSITHSQYVRVNLVDFEHPFLSRVWHGVHILDATSPLLTDRARQRIRENNGSWPSSWFDPEIIRRKLEFHDLIVTVAGISNVSAVTVHAYKRYKIGDVLIGYNFAPIVFHNVETGMLEVDMSYSNDVREQYGIRGEDLSIRRTGSKELAVSTSLKSFQNKLQSNIRIKKSKSGDALGVSSVTSHHSVDSKGSKFRGPHSYSPASSHADLSTSGLTTPKVSTGGLISPKLDKCISPLAAEIPESLAEHAGVFQPNGSGTRHISTPEMENNDKSVSATAAETLAPATLSAAATPEATPTPPTPAPTTPTATASNPTPAPTAPTPTTPMPMTPPPQTLMATTPTTDTTGTESK
ncbi:hypothetical protein ACHAWF_007053 [Thalassiosira exigua]